MTDAAPLPDARRFEALASAVAGRPVQVAWGTGPSWTDGRLIALDPALAAHARDAVIVQAALLGSGALDPDRVRRLRGRPKRIALHLEHEVPAALLQLAELLPPRTPGPEPAPWWGTIRPERLLRTRPGPPPSTPIDLIGAPPDDPALGGDGPTGERRPRGLGRRIADQGARRRARRRRSSSERSSLGEASATAAVRARQIAAPTRLSQTTAGPILISDGPDQPGALARYPEWDDRSQDYRTDWCEVHAPRTAPDAPLEPRAHPHAAASAARRRLARVHLDLRRVRRQRQGEELDLDAVVDHRISVAVGNPGDGRVYRDVVRRRRDLGVLVLVDGSGSTARTSGGGPSITERQLDAAAALVDAFDALGDRVACMVFRSHGRHRVEVTTVKGFDARFDPIARSRLASVQPEGFTRLGAAVRHATAIVRGRSGSRHQLLVVLSDGFPFDTGYQDGYARADVGRALAEARRAGVGALCLSIGAPTPVAELQAVFGAATYASGPDLHELGAALGTLVRTALAAADRSRRIPRDVSA